LESEVETLKKEYVRDVGKLKKRVEEAEKELEESRTEVTRLRNEMLDTDNQEFANKVKSSGKDEADFSFSKKIISRHQKEIEKLTQELDTMRSNDKKSKARIRQLETELEAALKRVTYSRGSNSGMGSPFNRSRGASPTSKTFICKVTILDSANRTGGSLNGRSYSPSFQRKDTPPKTYGTKQQSPSNRNIFNRTPPSNRKVPGLEDNKTVANEKKSLMF
jgi:hypothetical protein